MIREPAAGPQARTAFDELARRADAPGDGWALIALADAIAAGTVEPADPAAIRGALEQAAEAGNAFALVRLGDLAADQSDAAALYRRAADAGSDAGRQKLGEAMIAGRGVPKDEAGGLALLRRAAAGGDPWTNLALAGALLAGGPAPEEADEAVRALERSTSQGNAFAAVRLGELLRDGRHVPADPARATTLFRTAADAGLPLGKLRLGEALIAGAGVPPDAERGLALVREAAESGEPATLVGLGDALLGLETPDGTGAAEAFRRAAEAGDAYAFVRYGELYRDGALVEPDMPRALDAFARASAGGQAWIELERAAILRDGLGVPADPAAARAAYERAVDVDVPGARAALGRDMATGRLGGKRAEGVRMLRRAAEAGEPGALAALADATMWGWGLRQDQKRAMALLRDGAARGDLDAARGLVAAYRDGRYPLLKPAPARAARELAAIEDRLEPDVRALELFLLDAARQRGSRSARPLDGALADLPRSVRRPAFQALRWVDENAYTAVLQSLLRRDGWLTAHPTGRLSAGTIEAFRRMCRAKRFTAACRPGPLSETALPAAATLVR